MIRKMTIYPIVCGFFVYIFSIVHVEIKIDFRNMSLFRCIDIYLNFSHPFNQIIGRISIENTSCKSESHSPGVCQSNIQEKVIFQNEFDYVRWKMIMSFLPQTKCSRWRFSIGRSASTFGWNDIGKCMRSISILPTWSTTIQKCRRQVQQSGSNERRLGRSWFTNVYAIFHFSIFLFHVFRFYSIENKIQISFYNI